MTFQNENIKQQQAVHTIQFKINTICCRLINTIGESTRSTNYLLQEKGANDNRAQIVKSLSISNKLPGLLFKIYHL